MRRVLVLALLLLVLPASASAKVMTQTAQSGTTVATITWNTKGNLGAAKDITMTISDAGTQVVDASVPNNMYYTPVPEPFFDNKAVSVQDLDGDGTPEVIFELFTDGAHCCVLPYVYAGSTLVKRDFGNDGYTLKDIDGDGLPEFVSVDDNFDSAFGAHAGSIKPTQVLQFRAGKYVDVTRSAAVRPTLVKDGKRFARDYRSAVKQARKDPILQEVVHAALAAITANDCLLGDCSPGYAKVAAAVKRGVATRSFARRLPRFLKKFGYDA